MTLKPVNPQKSTASTIKQREVVKKQVWSSKKGEEYEGGGDF